MKTRLPARPRNKPKPPPKDLRSFHERKHKVLFNMRLGGLGDVLMQRMMFQDIHETLPMLEIHWALPKEWHDAATDHPDVHAFHDSTTVDTTRFGAVYNTCVQTADRYETLHAPCAAAGRCIVNHSRLKSIPIAAQSLAPTTQTPGDMGELRPQP